jgi:hypothetical protein
MSSRRVRELVANRILDPVLVTARTWQNNAVSRCPFLAQKKDRASRGRLTTTGHLSL